MQCTLPNKRQLENRLPHSLDRENEQSWWTLLKSSTAVSLSCLKSTGFKSWILNHGKNNEYISMVLGAVCVSKRLLKSLSGGTVCMEPKGPWPSFLTEVYTSLQIHSVNSCVIVFFFLVRLRFVIIKSNLQWLPHYFVVWNILFNMFPSESMVKGLPISDFNKICVTFSIWSYKIWCISKWGRIWPQT